MLTKKQKNYFSKLYKKERKRYYQNLDARKITDSKKFWKTIKPFFSDKGAGKNRITLIEEDDIIQDDCEIANIMNQHFTTVVESLNLSIPCEFLTEGPTLCDVSIENILLKYSNHPSIKLITENISKGSFSFSTVDVAEIVNQVKSLDVNKAAMSDGIPPKFLKENIGVCCEPLSKVINRGISSSTFDDSIKKADLTPIHKADDTTDKNNYRNISLLDTISKIFEKILQGQISAYMESFLSPYLCGYRKGYNSQHALILML